MSDVNRFDRRSLFDAFRRALASDEPREAPPNRGGFSLSAFYARREETAEGARPFPRFTCREGIAAVETTSTGAGPTVTPPREGVA